MSPRRVKRPADKEDIFKKLTDPEHKIFNSYKDLMMFASMLGYIDGKRKMFKKTSEPIPWEVFSGPYDETIINSLGFCEEQELNIFLENEENYDKKLGIFEEYANRGLEIIKSKILEPPGDPIDLLLDMILMEFKKEFGDEIGSFFEELVEI